MPTVLRDHGFQVRIYLPPREHPPAHVHVVKGNTEVILHLSAEGMPPVIREVHGMSDRDVLRAYRLVEANMEMLLTKWKDLHDEAT